jgi:hypothetical protein
VRAADNKALKACQAFAGDVLLIESEHDSIVPQMVLSSYREACTHARSLTYRCIAGADHGLTADGDQLAYSNLLVNWLTEMMAAAKAKKRVPTQAVHHREPSGSVRPETPPKAVSV